MFGNLFHEAEGNIYCARESIVMLNISNQFASRLGCKRVKSTSKDRQACGEGKLELYRGNEYQKTICKNTVPTHILTLIGDPARFQRRGGHSSGDPTQKSFPFHSKF